jgi:hypothetical protein
MKKAPQKFFLGCWRREGGGGGEGKINAIINQRPLRSTHG